MWTSIKRHLRELYLSILGRCECGGSYRSFGYAKLWCERCDKERV